MGDLPLTEWPQRTSLYERGDRLLWPYYRQKESGSREEVRVSIHLSEFQSSTHRGSRVIGYGLISQLFAALHSSTRASRSYPLGQWPKLCGSWAGAAPGITRMEPRRRSRETWARRESGGCSIRSPLRTWEEAWERQIRSIRRILSGLTREQVMTSEMLTTLLVTAEGIMNNQPLTPASSDPSNLEPLTPNHLLIHRPAWIVRQERLEARKEVETGPTPSGCILASMDSRIPPALKNSGLSGSSLTETLAEGTWSWSRTSSCPGMSGRPDGSWTSSRDRMGWSGQPK